MDKRQSILMNRHNIEDRGFETPCWIYQGSVNNQGYGRTTKGLAHRDYYEGYVGPIPTFEETGEHWSVYHRCPTNNCVNPEHLFLATRFEYARMRREGSL